MKYPLWLIRLREEPILLKEFKADLQEEINREIVLLRKSLRDENTQKAYIQEGKVQGLEGFLRKVSQIEKEEE